MLMLATTIVTPCVRKTSVCCAGGIKGSLDLKRRLQALLPGDGGQEVQVQEHSAAVVVRVSERLVCVLNTSFFRFGLTLEYDSSIIQIDNQSSVTCSVIFSLLKGT